MTATWHAVEEAFLEALEVEPASRTDFLNRRCAGDTHLRSQVEQLLAGHAGSEPEFITPPDTSPRHPARIGRYIVTRLIATGGMGAVYEAEQESPRRTVAVKVLRAALASPTLARRFMQESEVLARLRHPCIAQVYEAGVFEDGSGPVPFFAMELVEGARPLTDCLRDRPIPQILEVFLRVCDAVHHGHQRGVIHRDLKPGNILIDRAGTPKVIDFGIARDASDSMHTSAGQLIGTIAYMSPEQCHGDPSALDIRADVYSLGVVLYELLCGQTPFDSREKSILETARSIREDQPPRPSTIIKTIRADLETIILTAIHRERDRRYQSVADLAADIRRFLASEPIAARPATAIYQLRMFARRNRALAAGACIAFAGLLIGIAGTTWQAIRATDERDRARQAQKAADDEADTANRFANCLQDAIASMDPKLSRAALLHASADSVARELKDKPLAQARLFERLGETYSGMGLNDRSLDMYRAAAKILTDHNAPAHDLARVNASQATVHRHMSQWQASDEFCRLVLRHPARPEFIAPRTIAGGCLAIVLLRRNELAEAQSVAETALREAAAAKFHLNGLRSTLAEVLEARGNLTGARALLVEAVNQPDTPVDACLTRFKLAAFELRTRRPEAAAAAFAVAAESWRSLSKSQDPDTAQTCERIAYLLEANARWAAAEEFLREAMARCSSLYGPRHITIAELNRHLADVLQYLGRPAEAAACLREALSIMRSAVGDEHPDVGTCLFHLARLAVIAKDDKSLRQLRDEAAALEAATAKLPPEHPHQSGLLLLTGFIDMHLGDPAGAEPRLRECVRQRVAQLGPDARITVYAQTVLGECLALQGRFEEAQALLQMYVPRVEARYIPGSYMSAEARRRLIDLYTAWGRPQDAAEAAAPRPSR